MTELGIGYKQFSFLYSVGTSFRSSEYLGLQTDYRGFPVPVFQRIEDFLWVSTKCRLSNRPNFGKFLARQLETF
jgi:hypothetical protein